MLRGITHMDRRVPRRVTADWNERQNTRKQINLKNDWIRNPTGFKMTRLNEVIRLFEATESLPSEKANEGHVAS